MKKKFLKFLIIFLLLFSNVLSIFAEEEAEERQEQEQEQELELELELEQEQEVNFGKLESIYIYNSDDGLISNKSKKVENFLNGKEELTEKEKLLDFKDAFQEKRLDIKYFYRYIDDYGNIFVFDKIGNYSNITKGVSYKNSLFNLYSSNQLDLINSQAKVDIIEHNDYIVFVYNFGVLKKWQSYYYGTYFSDSIFCIYSKKENNFINILGGLYYNIEDFKFKISKNDENEYKLLEQQKIYKPLLYGSNGSNHTSYDINGNKLIIYTFTDYYKRSSSTKGLLYKNVIDFENLDSDLFNNNYNKIFFTSIDFSDEIKNYFDKKMTFSDALSSSGNFLYTKDLLGNTLFGVLDGNVLNNNIGSDYSQFLPNKGLNYIKKNHYSLKYNYVLIDDLIYDSYYINNSTSNYGNIFIFNKYVNNNTTSDFIGFGKTDFISQGLNQNLNLYDTYFLNKIILNSNGILFLKNGFGLYTNGKNNIAYAYNSNDNLLITEFGGWFSNIFTSYRLLDFGTITINGENYYIINFLKNSNFVNIKFKTLNELINGEGIEEEGLYYLGNVKDLRNDTILNIYGDNTLVLLKNFDKNSYMSNFFIGNYRGNLHLYYFNINTGYYVSNNPILDFGQVYYNGAFSPYNRKSFIQTIGHNNNNSYNNGIGEIGEDGDYTREELEEEKERLKTIKEELKEKENQEKEYEKYISKLEAYFGENYYVFNILKVLNFRFPDITDKENYLTLPYIKPVIENGKLKVGYSSTDIKLEKINDKLDINNVDKIEEKNLNVLKMISFFLALFYFFLRALVFGLLLCFIFIFYKIIKKLSFYLAPYFGNGENIKGNIISFSILIAFIILFGNLILEILSNLTYLFNFFGYIINIINIIFYFILSNFFDFEFFNFIVNLISNGFLVLIVIYLSYKISQRFGLF